MKATYITHSGDDMLVVNSARVSMAKESEYDLVWNEGEKDFDKVLSEKDVKLLTYLAKHKHWTPFAHPQITIRMSAPVPIRTQCFKHKQGFVENEESRRYISSTPELFMPEAFRCRPDNVKQGSAGEHEASDKWKEIYVAVCERAINTYIRMVEDGVCPEQARFVLPQGVKVNWVWTGSLAAYARFFVQRSDSHAQGEIQDLAKEVGNIIAPLFPESWKVLTQKEEV